MNQPQQPPVQQVADDEIDLRELFKVIWQGKWIIIATTFVFAVASVFYALSLPNIYKSEALLAPATEQHNAGLSGQLGGLAALAGVSLGGGGVDKTALAIEVVKSREFLGRFIKQRINLQDLMAAKSWDLGNNTINYDTDIFDPQAQRWLRDVKPPRQAEPSMQEAYKEFSEILTVSQDKATFMVKISIEHVSPYIAQSWLTMLVVDLNQEMKSRDMAEAEKSITYLQQQISQTNLADLKAAFFSLIEEQTKTLMLTKVRDEYAFKTIDPAIVPELKAKPARALIVILTAMLGGMLSSLIVVVRSIKKIK